MFFIMGINQKEKRLVFDQLVICKCCGKYGHLEVYLSYTYLMLFFIPIFKWNRRYYVRMSCCNSVCALDNNLGKAIERGEVTSLNPDSLHFVHSEGHVRCCSNCGFTTTEEYPYCPKCGRQM